MGLVSTNLFKLFKDIIEPEKAEQENLMNTMKKQVEEQNNMDALALKWVRTAPLGGISYMAGDIMSQMVDEVLKDYTNFNKIPGQIKQNKDREGAPFYKELNRRLNISSLRKKIGDILKKPPDALTKKDIAAMDIYADMSGLSSHNDVRAYYYQYDGLTLARKRISELIKACDKNILSYDEALKEFGEIVVDYPETFNMIPDEVVENKSYKNSFYKTLIDNQERLESLSSIIERNEEMGWEIPPESIEAKHILDELEDYIVSMRNSIDPNLFRDIDEEKSFESIQEEYNDMIKNVDYDNRIFTEEPVDDIPDEYFNQEFYDYLEEPLTEEINIDEYNFDDKSFENGYMGDINNYYEDDPLRYIRRNIGDNVDLDEPLVDMNIDLSSDEEKQEKLQKEKDLAMEKEINQTDLNFSVEDFDSLCQEWELSEFGGQIRYLPSEIKEGLAKIVAIDQSYYAKVPNDIKTKTNIQNKVFYDTLEKEIKLNGNEMTQEIRNEINLFKEANRKEKVEIKHELGVAKEGIDIER